MDAAAAVAAASPENVDDDMAHCSSWRWKLRAEVGVLVGGRGGYYDGRHGSGLLTVDRPGRRWLAMDADMITAMMAGPMGYTRTRWTTVGGMISAIWAA